MEKEYRVYVKVYHSFTVEADSLEKAHEIASQDVIWDDHIIDCDIEITEE